MTVNLGKGGNISLSKEEPGLKKILVGLGWDITTTAGVDFDLDASLFMLADTGRVRSDNDFIFYNNLKSSDGSVEHTGDNRTGAGEGDDEVIKVDLQKVPADVTKLVIGVTIHDADVRKQNFGMVESAFIRIINQDNKREIVRFDLSEDMSIETAMLFGEVYRHGVDWKFRAIGQGFKGGLGPMAKSYGISLVDDSDSIVTPSAPTGEITNSLGMTFRLIPAGTFMMGSPISEKDRFSNEIQHQVTLTRAYYMQTTQVTQGQWNAVMWNIRTGGDNCPVGGKSWDDTQRFITKLNQQEKTDIYRLPTEAEWEYACRAGTTTAYYFGDDAGSLEKYAWYSNNAGGKTHPVGELQPNAWGLYDMNGNVGEWCQDWWSGDYSSVAATDPVGPERGSSLVFRGGSWRSSAQDCRSAFRNGLHLSASRDDLGFRLVCSAGHQ